MNKYLSEEHLMDFYSKIVNEGSKVKLYLSEIEK